MTSQHQLPTATTDFLLISIDRWLLLSPAQRSISALLHELGSAWFPLGIPLATGCSYRLHHRLEQVDQVGQVVRNHVQDESSTDVVLAAQFELAQPAERFDPAEHLFDPPASIDRQGVAPVTGGAAIDRGTSAAGGVLSQGGMTPNEQLPIVSRDGRVFR